MGISLRPFPSHLADFHLNELACVAASGTVAAHSRGLHTSHLPFFPGRNQVLFVSLFLAAGITLSTGLGKLMGEKNEKLLGFLFSLTFGEDCSVCLDNAIIWFFKLTSIQKHVFTAYCVPSNVGHGRYYTVHKKEILVLKQFLHKWRRRKEGVDATAK